MTKRRRSIRMAMTNPFRLPFTWWPWRTVGYLLASIPLALLLMFTTFVFTLTIIGVPLAGMPLAAAERYRLRWLDQVPVVSPHPVPDRPGLGEWLGTRLRQPATWIELAYAVLFGGIWIADAVVALLVVGVCLVFLGLPLWLRLLPGGHVDLGRLDIHNAAQAWWTPLAVAGAWPVVAYLLCGYGTARVALVRVMLARPSEEELGSKVNELVKSRARLADAAVAERRRIERDLHDGAQQRLASLAMTLGLAKLELDEATPELRELVNSAYSASRDALQELRDLIRGIYPPVLTDRGLGAAVAEAAERLPIPVDIDIDLPSRPSETVESTAYFVTCEALANIAKHSGAASATVYARYEDSSLVLEIRDDGKGGADSSHGSGLVGMADRAAVHGGVIRVSSPEGGPTTIRMEVSCELLLPMIRCCCAKA